MNRWLQLSLRDVILLVAVIALTVYGVSEHRLRMQAEQTAEAYANSMKMGYETFSEFARAVESHGWNSHTESRPAKTASP